MMLTKGKTEITPAEAGYNEERLDALHKHFQRLINEKKIQCGIYCLSRKGKIFAHGAVGRKTFNDENTPAQPDSVRYIASVTKAFTAVAIMKLVDDGLTRLDVPVGEILPQFNTPPLNQINLFHLLSHTSGLHADPGCYENKYQTSYYETIDLAYKNHDPKKDGEFDWIAAALGTIGSGMRMNSGLEWSYCSFGYMILGAVIEKLTGIHAHTYIEENICKPLGMNDTRFKITPEMAKRYVCNFEDQLEKVNNVLAGKEEEFSIWGDKIPKTGGGLISTAYDMTIFGNMALYGGTFNGTRIMGRKTMEKMTTALLRNTPNYTWFNNEKERLYGAGFDMRQGLMFTHSEGTFFHEGFGFCGMYIDPKEELVASWYTPFTDDGWYPEALMNVQSVIWSGLI
ncbi:MAG: beta-lactamase family protein [Defluviitaleaceae bacterium]|nr:beta-lactamase family protein [Defluviitaleaceae bacterium]